MLVAELHTPHQPVVHLHSLGICPFQPDSASRLLAEPGTPRARLYTLAWYCSCSLHFVIESHSSAQQGRAPDLTAKVASSSRDDVKQICNDAGITADVQLFQPAKDNRLCSSHPTKTVVSSVTPVLLRWLSTMPRCLNSCTLATT